MPCEDLKRSELPTDSDQIRLDFSHNPFAPQVLEEAPSINESQLLLALSKTAKTGTTFVEVESYENLRARVENLTKALQAAKLSLKEKDLSCQQTEEEVSAASRTICGLRRDIRDLVTRIEN